MMMVVAMMMMMMMIPLSLSLYRRQLFIPIF